MWSFSLEVEKQAYKESFIKAGLVIQDSLNVEEKFVCLEFISRANIEQLQDRIDELTERNELLEEQLDSEIPDNDYDYIYDLD